MATIAGLIALIILTPQGVHQAIPSPAPGPTTQYTEIERTPPPTNLPDIIPEPAAPTRLQVPSVGFDSDALVLPAAQTERIIEWTAAMNKANNYRLEAPEPGSTTMVWDSTVTGGGLCGANVQTSCLITGHTSPNVWKVQGVFQPLMKVLPGNPIALTTETGLLCGYVDHIDITSKSEKVDVDVNGDGATESEYLSDYKYRLGPAQPGFWYIAFSNREPDDKTTNATTHLRVLVVRFDQDQTNTGSCW